MRDDTRSSTWLLSFGFFLKMLKKRIFIDGHMLRVKEGSTLIAVWEKLLISFSNFSAKHPFSFCPTLHTPPFLRPKPSVHRISPHRKPSPPLTIWWKWATLNLHNSISLFNFCLPANSQPPPSRYLILTIMNDNNILFLPQLLTTTTIMVHSLSHANHRNPP